MQNFLLHQDPSIERIKPGEPLQRETYESIFQRLERIAKARGIVDNRTAPRLKYATPWLPLVGNSGLSVCYLDHPNVDWRLQSPYDWEAQLTLEDIIAGKHHLVLNGHTRTINDLGYFNPAAVREGVAGEQINQEAARWVDAWLKDATTTLAIPSPYETSLR